MRSLAVLAALFVAVSAAVAANLTRDLDRATLDAARSVASPAFDLLASVVSVFGQVEVTGAVALVLALLWWRREGVPGLVPLLLFVGVGVEIALKYVVPHPAPPLELDRDLGLLVLLKGTSPYSFPSGHVLRATFLATLVGDRAPAWRGVLWSAVAAMLATRVYLAEHWLSDVVGGLLLGLVLVQVARLLRGRA